jgi:hypothetical protein
MASPKAAVLLGKPRGISMLDEERHIGWNVGIAAL